MSEVLTQEKRKARKQHACSYCRGVIEAGSEYCYASGVTDGSFWVFKSHEYCDAIVQDMFKTGDYWDGIGRNEFEDQIWYLCEKVGIDPRKPMSFAERVKMVFERLEMINE